MAIAEIYVTLKPALLDVQGATVLKSLHQLGHAHAADVRIGKYITVAFDDAVSSDAMQAHLDAMCRELLANPVIEDYRISLNGASNGVPAAPLSVPSVVAGDVVPNPAPQRAAAGEAAPVSVTAANISAPQPVSATVLAPAAPAGAVTAAPSEVSTATSAAAASTTIADPFAVAYADYVSMSADEQLELQGRAWQQHGAWIQSELAAHAATWILCVGRSVAESGTTLDSYPSETHLATVGTANDLVPWVFTRAPQD